MKKEIAKRSEQEVAAEYPIAGIVPGWFFRKTEISNGGWEVVGTDLWGRSVSKQGDDPDQLLNECVEWARTQTKS